MNEQFRITLNKMQLLPSTRAYLSLLLHALQRPSMSTDETHQWPTDQELHDQLIGIDPELHDQRMRELTEELIDNLIMEAYRVLVETDAVVAGVAGEETTEDESVASTIVYDYYDMENDTDATSEEGSSDDENTMQSEIDSE